MGSVGGLDDQEGEMTVEWLLVIITVELGMIIGQLAALARRER